MRSPNCLLSSEDIFKPIVEGCGLNFDFTLLFEETILCILPACLAAILAILRIVQLRSKGALFKGGFILPLKLVRLFLFLPIAN